MADNKTELIRFRLTKKEKNQIKAAAKKQGLDSMSGYLLFLVRKDRAVKKLMRKV